MGHASPVLDEAFIREASSRTRPPAEFRFHSLVLSDPEKIAGRRSFTFGVSVALHSLLVAAAVVLPLLFYDVLPGEYALKTFFVAPLEVAPPPPPPPPPAAGAARRVARPAPAVEVAPPSGFVAPIEVPDEIQPEESLDVGIEGGVPGGVEGGVPGGVVGGIVGGLPAAPPPPAARVVRIGGQLVAPRIVRKVPPVFPDLAVQSRASAVVILEAEVDPRGYVRSVKVLRGHPLFDAAAMDAVRQWRYQPLLLNGEPTAFILTVTVSFTLQQK
ncbi:MAG TPA: TonB family protein [Vicinamibacteria bacterium]|nr:TonB family protein [Vicinamibacteria bacterium]